MTLAALDIASALLGLVAALALLVYMRLQERRYQSLTRRITGVEAVLFPEEFKDGDDAEANGGEVSAS